MRVVSAVVLSVAVFGSMVWADPPKSAEPRPPQLIGQYSLTKPKPLALLHATFQDHAVLQRDRPIPVWGTAAPKAKISVTLGGKTLKTAAGKSGKWLVEFSPLSAGGPYTLSAEASDGQKQTVSDILIGDVFLCSGQSNMEMPVQMASNYGADLREANNANLRLFHVQRFPSAAPRDTFGADAGWAVTSPQSVADFSAACYNFGKNLQPVVKVPVGLIEDAWGGSIIQAWLSAESLRKLGGYDGLLDLLPVYAADPRAAEDKWADMAARWWGKRDPALAANPAWSDPAYDDAGWQTVTMTGTWRFWGPAETKTFNGIVWMRKTVELSEAQAGAATLSLGPVDSVDVLFVNGKRVGAGRGYDMLRNYEISAGLLHPGKNVIAWAVQGGAGPLFAGEKMLLKTAGGTVPLAGPWRFKTSAPIAQTGNPPGVPWLNQFGMSDLHNGMILPLGKTGIRGIVWYQGESNEGEDAAYAKMLPLLFADWRKQFGADTPVAVVQLPNFGPYRTEAAASNWAAMREAQRRAAADDKRAALVTTIDIGQMDNIHPANKQEVGRRIALAMRKLVYGEEVVASGPAPVSATVRGSSVTVRFSHPGTEMVVYGANRPVGFQLCDAAKVCRFVDATRSGDDIVLDAAGIAPAFVRFGWADSPLINVYDSTGLPAGPFEMAATATP